MRQNNPGMLLFLLGALLGYTPATAGAQEDWRARFLTEGRAAWKRYQEEAINLHGTYSRTIIEHPSGKVLKNNHLELKRMATCALMRYGQRLEVYNPRYGFCLNYRGSDQPWLLESIDPTNTYAAELHRNVGVMATYGLTLFGVHNYLPTMLEDPDLHITAVTPITREGITLVKVSFRRPNTDRNVAPVVSGDVWLRPDRYWMIEEFDVVQEIIDKGLQIQALPWKGRIVYETLADGFPVVKSHVFHYQVTNASAVPQAVTHEHRFDFKMVRMPLTEADFSFTAFGIPELSDATRAHPVPWHWWLAAVAGLCLLLGLVSHRLVGTAPGARTVPFRFLSPLLYACGLATLAVAGWLWWEQEQEQLQPTVVHDQRVFQEIALETTQDITFRLHNPRREAIRLVGMEFP